MTDSLKQKQHNDINDVIDEAFQPFVSQGFVSLLGVEKRVSITILRDTSVMQSQIRCGVFPFSAQSY